MACRRYRPSGQQQQTLAGLVDCTLQSRGVIRNPISMEFRKRRLGQYHGAGIIRLNQIDGRRPHGQGHCEY